MLFLDEPEVRVERLYGLRLDSLTEPLAEDVVIPSLMLRFENTEADGLGEPLPSGVVRVFESYAGRDVLAGEAEVGDRPVGLARRARDRPRAERAARDHDGLGLAAAATAIASSSRRSTASSTTRRCRSSSRSATASRTIYTDVELERSSRPMRRKYGDLAWRFAVPPGEELLRYELSALEPE